MHNRNLEEQGLSKAVLYFSASNIYSRRIRLQPGGRIRDTLCASKIVMALWAAESKPIIESQEDYTSQDTLLLFLSTAAPK